MTTDLLKAAGYDTRTEGCVELAAYLAGARTRGLLITGDPGLGKTFFMATFLAKYPLKMREATEVVDMWREADGWSRGLLEDIIGLGPESRDFVLDDLGREPIGVLYGMRDDVSARLIEFRYKAWKNHGAKTHITTNLHPAALADRYGARVMDRLAEMSEMVQLQGKSYRQHEAKGI